MSKKRIWKKCGKLQLALVLCFRIRIQNLKRTILKLNFPATLSWGRMRNFVQKSLNSNYKLVPIKSLAYLFDVENDGGAVSGAGEDEV